MKAINIDIIFIIHTGISREGTDGANRYDLEGEDVYEGKFYAARERWPMQAGMGIIWKKELKPYINIRDEADRILTLDIMSAGQSTTIMGIYAPPDIGDRETWRETLLNATARYRPHHILGDFNEYHDITLDRTSTVQPLSFNNSHLIAQKLNSRGYVDTFRTLHPNKRSFSHLTHIRAERNVIKTRIDHIFSVVDHINNVVEVDYEDKDRFTSDHRLVYCKILTNLGRRSTLNIPEDNKYRVKGLPIETWTKNYHNKISKLKNWKGRSQDVNEIESDISKKIMETIKKCCPVQTRRTPRRTSHKRTRHEKELCTQFKFLSALYHRCKMEELMSNVEIQEATRIYNELNLEFEPDSDNITHMCSINEVRGKISTKIRKIKVAEKRTSIRKRINELIHENVKNPFAVFKALKRRNYDAGIEAVRIDDVTHIEPNTVKMHVAASLSSIYNSNKIIPEILPDLQSRKIGEEITDLITIKELDETLKELSNNTSPGIDDVPNEALKNIAGETKIELLQLLNKCIQKNELPTTWRTAPVCLIHKDGDKANPLNYRPIALLCTMYKVLSSIINKRLIRTLDKENVLHPDQFGFRKGMSTAQCFADHIACIEDSLQRDKDLYMIYIDLRKAYDSVEHQVLVNTLRKYNFNERTIQLIKLLLSENTLQFKTAHGLSPPVNVGRGVRQGDIISPTLFLIFINPLIERLHEMTERYTMSNGKRKITTFYADDGVLYAETEDAIRKAFGIVNEF